MTVLICQTDKPKCNVRYQARGVRYYCRLTPGHAGAHTCPADQEDGAS